MCDHQQTTAVPVRLIYRVLVIALVCCFPGRQASAQQAYQLTFDSAVDIAMARSYRIKQLEMGIERTRKFLESRQAGLKSHVSMRLKAPEIKSVAETKWNSTLQKDEIVHENTSLWQWDLSVRQPVILFGYPTNGYLSLNNRLYRYLQGYDEQEIDYYNRYYLKFEQPFFQPNNLKNNIEDAELDLERNELEYIRDRVRLINDVADDYYDLFDTLYKDKIYQRQIATLDQISELVSEIVSRDTTRAIEAVQTRVELANAREQMLKNQTDIRREKNRIKQRLQLAYDDSVYLEPDIEVEPVNVDLDQAIQYGFSLQPTLRMLEINKRRQQIDLNNSKGWDAFRVNLEMTYGLERQEEQVTDIWNDFAGSHSISVSAYVPIWDWGRRKARIQAYEITVQKTEMYIEENRNEIQSDIRNAVQNLKDYQRRALDMQLSVEMVAEVSEVGMKQYDEGTISLQDLLQMVRRQTETELNLLDAYLGYRRSLLSLMNETYYDYENGVSLIEKYKPKT